MRSISPPSPPTTTFVGSGGVPATPAGAAAAPATASAGALGAAAPLPAADPLAGPAAASRAVGAAALLPAATCPAVPLPAPAREPAAMEPPFPPPAQATSSPTAVRTASQAGLAKRAARNAYMMRPPFGGRAPRRPPGPPASWRDDSTAPQHGQRALTSLSRQTHVFSDAGSKASAASSSRAATRR